MASSHECFIDRLNALADAEPWPGDGMRDVRLECERNPPPSKAPEEFFAGWWDGDNRWILLSPQPWHQFLSQCLECSHRFLDSLPADHEWRKIVADVPLPEQGPGRWCYLLCRLRGRHDVEDNWQQWKVSDWLLESIRLLRTTAAPTAGSETPEELTSGAVNDKAKRKTWRQVQTEALNHLKRNPWPGLKVFARLLECSPSTLSTACKNDAELMRVKQDHESRDRSVSGRQMHDAIRDGIAVYDDSTGVDESDLEPIDSDTAETLLQRLLAECKTDEAQKQFYQMTEAERLKAALIRFSDPDSGKDIKRRVRERSQR